MFPNILALGNQTGHVIVRDTAKDAVVSSIQRHSSSVTGITFIGNHKAVVTTGMDNKICLYDYNTSECVFRMNIHQAITASDVSPDSNYIAAGLDDGSIYIYDIREPLKPLICANIHDCAVNRISFEKTPEFVEKLDKKTSATTLNESEFENHSEVSNSMGDTERHNYAEEKFKRDLLKMVKTHMNYLETQLSQHCTKFQSFIANEFDAIHNAMARWDVFNVQNTSEFVQAIDSTESKSLKSASTRKSRCQIEQ
ncbi:hypothetical protein JTB14_010735 [Gonioctena quinquepunctata]|nr:hypothetical protein JTB14_010735 [Gonioctena quinquepunctata]